MSVTINIKGTQIDFPSSGESPNWAPAVIEFAQTVEDAIASAVGQYDIPNKTFTLVNPVDTTPLAITDLSFPTSAVRAAFVKYSVIRITTNTGFPPAGGVTKTETGNIMVVYDGSNWTLGRDYVGDANCAFDITSSGQIRITTTALTGTYTSGKVSFSAQALVQ